MKKYFIKSFVSLFVLGSAQMALAQAVPTLYVDTTEVAAASNKCLMLSATTLKYGATDATTNGEVSSLQAFLISKNLLAGSPTGFYGKMTEDAVKAYQRSSGIDLTGSAGPITRGTISNETCTFSYNTSEASSNEVTVCTAERRTCADGSPMPQGPGCGWHPEQCPGRTPSGAITYGGSNLTAADEIAMNTGVPTSMAYASSQAPQVLGASTMCLNLPSNLHRGAESSSVTKLQKFLATKGFLTTAPTGFYGDMTVEAVKLYQSSVGINATGMVYELTRQAIQGETCN